MRLFAILLTTLLGLPLAAQEFDFRGLPAEASILVTFQNTSDLELAKMPAMQAIRARMKSAKPTVAGRTNNAEMEKKLKDELGFDFEKDLQSAVLGAAVRKKGATSEIRAAGVLRGHFNAAKFAAFAAKHRLATATVGDHRGWYMAEFLAALTGATAKPDRENLMFLVDGGTMLIAQRQQAAASLASLAGQGATPALPGYARALLPAGGRNYGLIHVDASALPDSPELAKSGLANADLTLSEVGTSQVYQLSAEFTDEPKAQQGAKQVQGMLAMAPLLAMPNPKDAPELQRLKQAATKVLGGFQPVRLEGRRATTVLKVENTDMVELIDVLTLAALAGAPTGPAK